MNIDSLTRIEDKLTGSVADTAAWTSVFGEIARSANALGAAILPVRGRDPQIVATDGVVPLFDSYLREGWAQRDARYVGVSILMRKGILVDQDFITPDAMDRDPFWGDLLGPHGLRWFCGVLIRADGDLWCLALQRTPDQGAFLPNEQRSLASISPYLSRAATRSRKLLHASLNGAVDVLDALGSSVFVLDREGNIIRHNGGAERYLKKEFDVRNKKLSITGDIRTTNRLVRHLRAVSSGLEMQSNDRYPVIVHRDNGLPLFLQAQPLRGILSGLFSPGRILLHVADLDNVRVAPVSVMQSMFGLTLGEARISHFVASGISLQAAAEKSGITYETARTYLKGTFLKLGICSQAELAVRMRVLGLELSF